MKVLLLLASLVAANASPLPIFGHNHMNNNIDVNNVAADSPLGLKILANARRLDDTIDFTWVSGFSMKFQGCHHMSQWNANVDSVEDVRIETKRLIRFRLCPTSSCTSSNAGGCKAGYGDYVIDMNTYLTYYQTALETYNDYLCSSITCDCDSSSDQDTCQYTCYNAKGLDVICGIKNPNNQNGNNNKNNNNFKIQDYMGCGKVQFNNVKYYLGPYCSEQGGAIFLGLFSDDSCTTFTDESSGASTYLTAAGTDMPYATTNIVNMDCLDCSESADYQAGNDANDVDTVKEVCENIYKVAGKCETNLAISNKNNVACTYMEGIKITRKDGTIVQSKSGSKTASVFIGLFCVSFCFLAAYVYYLKTKLDRASINLSD